MLLGQSRRRWGFTLIELLVVIAIIAILIAILVPALGAARRYALQAKDSTHVRSIVQGMIVWAGQHDGDFPRPSSIDLAGNTIDSGSNPGLVKDNTGNILSVLIFNGMLEAQQAISPAETNELIVRDTEYEKDEASLANRPELALWDPGFAGFPGEQDSFSGVPSNGRRKGESGEAVGHTSYATAFPFGERSAAWNSDFAGNSVVAGNRGPIYQGTPGNWRLHLTLGVNSNTLRFYGADNEWNGHLAYGDGRVEFTKQPDPVGLKMSFGTGSNTSSFADNVFYNENDNDATANAAGDQDRPGRWTNAYLRPWGNVTIDSDVDDPRVALFWD
ncbi:MAG: prepilin-type N-terminal cleavage/methylation domain-containing protein [Planctomycetota bacterium]|nr:prepilin-type N-terminal cleavage/methylation domain-containing protein [Planctomycetota bacterium]